MNLIETYDILLSAIKVAFPNFLVIDSLVNPPATLPAIAIVPKASPVLNHLSGSRLTGNHIFEIFIIYPLPVNSLTPIYSARQKMMDAIKAILDIPKISITEPITYAEDVVNNQKATFAKITLER